MQGAADAREYARLAELLGKTASIEAMRQSLCEKIASGIMTLDHPGLREHLRATAIDRMAIDQPDYSAYRAAVAGTRPGVVNNNEPPES